MLHLDSTTTDSALAWTQSPLPGLQSVELRGPRTIAAPSAAAYVRLSSNAGAGSRAEMVAPGVQGSQVSVQHAAGFNMTDSQRGAFVQSNYPGWNGYGAGTDNVSDVYYHRTGPTFSRVGRGDYSGGGGSFVEKAYVGVNGVTAAVIGENEAIIRSNLGTGEYVQATGGDIHLGPTNRLTLNGRPGYLPLGAGQYNLPGNLIGTGYRSFLMNGISTTTGAVGDFYIITATCRVFCLVVGGAFQFEYQGFGGGAGVSTQRGIATNWALGHDQTVCASWLFVQTVAGPIVWTIVGGQTGGNWGLIAPDTMFTVVHYGIR